MIARGIVAWKNNQTPGGHDQVDEVVDQRLTARRQLGNQGVGLINFG